MSIQQALFVLFSVLAVATALMVIFSSNPVRAVLALVATFVSSAVLWMLAEAEFLALILILVYVGAVMTLFLFVVMMMDIDVAVTKHRFIKYLPIAIAVAALLVGFMFYMIKSAQLIDAALPHGAMPVSYSNTAAIGKLLYTDYGYAFELAGILLLVAIIAAISLVFRGTRDSKVQQPDQQIRVNPKDRVRLVQMRPEIGE